MAIPLRPSSNKANPINLIPNVERSIKPDIRLWVGIALMLLSVVGITKAIAHADSRIPLVALAQDVPAGKVLTPSDLQVVKVSVPNPELYFTDLDLALGFKVSRAMNTGELLALSQNKITNPNSRIVSIPIRAGHLPNVIAGDLVDIWYTPATDAISLPTYFDGEAKLLVSGVTVSEVPDGIDSTSDTAISAIIPIAKIGKVLAAVQAGQLDIVGHVSGGGTK